MIDWVQATNLRSPKSGLTQIFEPTPLLVARRRSPRRALNHYVRYFLTHQTLNHHPPRGMMAAPQELRRPVGRKTPTIQARTGGVFKC